MKKLLPFFAFFLACTSEVQPWDEKEYLAFGESIGNAILNRDSEQLDKHFLPQEGFNKLKAGIDSLDAGGLVTDAQWTVYFKEYEDGFIVGLESLSRALQGSGTVEVSRFYTLRGRPHVVLAFTSPMGGDMVDFELKTTGKGTFITDYYSFNTGLAFSESYAWNAIYGNILSRGLGDYAQAREELFNAQTYLERGQPDRAWEAFNRIPEEFRHFPHFQPVEVMITAQVSDSLYAEALAEWIGNNWDEPRFRHHKMIHYHTFVGDTAAALRSLDSLIQWTGQNTVTHRIRESISPGM